VSNVAYVYGPDFPCHQALLLNETLHTLDLSCCRLGPSAALVLSQGVRRNTHLRRLICDTNHLGEPGGRQLLGSLMYNHDLELLSLRGISFRDTVDTKVCITTHPSHHSLHSQAHPSFGCPHSHISRLTLPWP
jgi:hypothetical protein